jgi:ABC-2 type transport system ATP-binding protein
VEDLLGPSNTFAVETRNLRKIFWEKVAVRGLSLTVRRVEIYGFLGPNGAGKSTSIKLLLGPVKPTAGEALILGVPLKVRRNVGLLPDDFHFYEWLIASELLHLHGRLSRVSAAELSKRVPATIAYTCIYLLITLAIALTHFAQCDL